MALLQTSVQSRYLGHSPLRSVPRVYAQIARNPEQCRDMWTRYRFLADSQSRLVCEVADPAHAAFLLATGNFTEI